VREFFFVLVETRVNATVIWKPGKHDDLHDSISEMGGKKRKMSRWSMSGEHRNQNFQIIQIAPINSFSWQNSSFWIQTK
jgi:hypothetical protein